MKAVVITSPANAGWGGGKGLIAIYTSKPAVKHRGGRFHQAPGHGPNMRGRVHVHITSSTPCLDIGFKETFRTLQVSV